MRRFVFTLTICTLVLFASLAAHAGNMTFDEAAYRSLAAAQSSIPAGTTITLSNWQQYRKFMPVTMQALYSGEYAWKIGSGPEYSVQIGPVTNFHIPAKLLQDSEKYSGQVKLVRLPDSGYTYKGYVAGIPFPQIQPNDPQAGAKIVYNAWLVWAPALSDWWVRTTLVDKYLNISAQTSEVTQYKLSAVSDGDFPINPPYGHGYLVSNRFFVLEPEQTKYTAEVQLQPDDPAKLQELYVFLPSLRRTLRLSSAARCAPILGTDYINDDAGSGFDFQPTAFQYHYLGEKSILTMAPPHIRPSDAGAERGSFGRIWPAVIMKGSAPGWPASSAGKWELRDMYVVDMVPLPNNSSYCYTHKVAFIDKQTWNPMGNDIYDRQQKLWKWYNLFWTATRLNNGEEALVREAPSVTNMIDFQNVHASMVQFIESIKVDSQVPTTLQDAKVWAFPAGLSQINK